MEPNLHTDADKYQAGMGSWSKTLAPLFLEFIDGIKEGDRVLDVGCGTGSLTFTIADTTKASTVVGIDPSVGYLEYARAQNSHPHVAFDIGDAQKLPYDDGSFDCCVSSLMVQFVSDAHLAAKEMRRVTKKGRSVATCAWDNSGGMELHGRGIEATCEHIERAGINSSMHVLDLGWGVGGCSRVIAATCGCRVTAIDLTPQFIEVARELTRRCGMADRIEFRQGDALDLPLAEGTFDHVWCHNVTMNIQDKRKLASEVARVLKRGGRFSCCEVGQGTGGPLIFPLPWATDESASFLVTPAMMRQALEEGGLRISEEIDLTDAWISFLREMRARAERGDPPLAANHVIVGDDIGERVKNAGRCAMEKRTVEHFILAEKP